MVDAKKNAAEHLDQWSRATSIQPPFPNWDQSFISGHQSILFRLDHRIAPIEIPHTLYTQIQYLKAAEGPPGHVHGGATAGLVDELMGIVVWHHQYPCVTQSLNCQFLKPIHLNSKTFAVTEIIKNEKKKLEVATTIYADDLKTMITAQGIFHHLSQAQLDHFSQSN